MCRSGSAIIRAAVLAVTLTLAGWLAAGAAQAAAPTSTPADPAMPNSIAVLGDSMSVATGTQGIPASEQPQNSWSTGTNSSVNSLYQRILALNPAINGKNRNKAGNGEDMNDGPNQANSVEADTDLITLQLGGNNLCKDSVNDMTTPAQYRTSFVNTLNNLQNRAPDALIQIQSVPDIYNLWFLRGAPNPPNSQPSSRAGTARIFWDTLSLIPCESLVNNPTSMSEGDLARRDLVRQRNLEYNRILAEECEARLRCRFDRYATFVFSSNRSDPFVEPARTLNYLPRNTWQFVDDDISTIDHFHPSTSGQRKMAQAAWESGFQFTDSTMPASTVNKIPAPLQSGTSFLPTTVNLTWSDAAGIKGVQYRTHKDGNVSEWTTQLGTLNGSVIDNKDYGYLSQKSFSVNVPTPGITYVESRAMDANGNLSASRITEVNYDPNALPAPQINGKPSENTASTAASFTFTGIQSGLSYECSLDGAAFSACTSPHSLASLSSGDHEFRVRLKSSLATGPAATYSWRVDTSAPVAPMITGKPPANTTNPNANFFFSGTEATLECSVDGAPFATCTSPMLVPVISDGTHTFSVRHKNVLGTPGESATYEWTLDRTAPAAPTIESRPTSPTNSTTATINFSGEPGGTLQCHYSGPDTNHISTCNSGTWTRDLLKEGSHSLAVSQKDDLGNHGPAATYTWTVDLTDPPAPTIDSGPPALTASRDASVSFTGEAGGSFQCALDDASFFFCSSPRELTGLEDGEHQLRIRQVDDAGNAGPAVTRPWTVDGTGPAAPGLSGPASPTASADAQFVFTGEPGGSFECSLGETAFSACSSPASYPDLTSGVHRFRVRQFDALGNPGEVSEHVWTIDRTPPAAPQIGPLGNEIRTDLSQVITFTGEPGGNFECMIAEGAWSDCGSPWNATFPGDGTHAFSVRQIDALGNVGPAASGSLTFDVTAPGAPVVSSAPRGTVRLTSARVTFNLETGASGECRLNGGSWTACAGTWSATRLGQGRQKLEIRQSDPGGTSTVVSVTWTVDTVPPRLASAKVKRKGKARKGKPAIWVLTSRFVKKSGKPASLEFSLHKKKPKPGAKPVKNRTRKWAPKLTIKSKQKPAWVRARDQVGNASGWLRVK